MQSFTPMYILPNELSDYDLPTSAALPAIQSLVQMASLFLDEECGRYDGDGNGSLVYTTYVQRLLLQTRNRNLIYLASKPITPITQATVNELQTAATGAVNYTYTGVQASTVDNYQGNLSGILAASGRYSYPRQDLSVAFPDQWQLTPLTLVTLAGGPAPWVAIDITNTDYDSKTGEVWVPAGLQLQSYSEMIFTYNSGYDPRRMPPLIKHACASLVKSAMARGNATTNLMSMNLGKSGANATFSQSMLDPTIDRMINPFRTVRAY